ncbi:MAG: DNA-directed RNA polymerase subunit K [Candidatus Bilamarchaeaceae archaeon]
MKLTKYELARIIGARAAQLASGAPPLIKAKKGVGFLELAKEELENGVIPLAVLRESH